MKAERYDVILCRWFLGCKRPAGGYIENPVFGDVPTCERCATIALDGPVEHETGDQSLTPTDAHT